MLCIYILWRLGIASQIDASQIDGYKIHPIFQTIEKHVTQKIKWFYIRPIQLNWYIIPARPSKIGPP
jgi:hypothetical protein